MEVASVSKKRKTWLFVAAAIVVLVLLCGGVAGINFLGSSSGGKVLTQTLSAPLDEATTAKVDINTGTGNLTIDRLTSGEALLARGTLEFLEGQGPVASNVDMNNHHSTLTLKASGGRQSGFHLPWEACNGETNWQVHLNPTLPTDISAYTGGGNVKLDLAGMALTSLAANTGGGNMDVVLPDHAANLNVTAKSGAGDVTVEIGSGTTGSNTVIATSGAGNVVVHLPAGIAARVHVNNGMGKATVDPQFSKIDDHTYQSPNYDSAADKIEITVESGAGNVTVNTK